MIRPRYLRPSLDIPQIYLYRAPVDFRKQVNGLAALVEQELAWLFCYLSWPRLQAGHGSELPIVGACLHAIPAHTCLCLAVTVHSKAS